MAAATTAAPVMSLFMSSIDAAGFRHKTARVERHSFADERERR